MLRRTILPLETKIESSKGLVTYIASDQTLDSYREIILAAGWRFDHFAKNAPFVDSHDYWSIEKLLGSVIDAKVTGTQLIETVQWAHDIPENPLAALGWKMTLAGHLRAVSVGFRPVKAINQGDPEFYKTASAAGIDQAVALETRRIFTEQQQLELSACIIGANPAALATAHKSGDITDADLHSIGYRSDDDLDFLHRAAQAYPTLSPDHQTLIRQALHCITSAVAPKHIKPTIISEDAPGTTSATPGQAGTARTADRPTIPRATADQILRAVSI